MVCSRCGAPLEDNQRYCMKCGALNYNHPDNQKMKNYITDKEIEKSNIEYQERSYEDQTETIEFAGRKYTRNINNKKSYVDSKAAFGLLLLITIGFGLLLYFKFYYSLLMLGILCLIYFIISFYVIVNSCVYMKGGYSGFTPIIPFYNQYAYFDMAVGHGWHFIFLIIPIFGQIYFLYATYKLGKKFGRSGWLTLLFPFIVFPIIAFSELTIYQGDGVKYEKFSKTGKRRNTKIPTFCYCFLILILFLGFVYKDFDNDYVNKLYLYEVEKLVKSVEKHVLDGRYICDQGNVATKDGVYYIPFDSASELFEYPIPTQSPFNGKKLHGYVKVVNNDRNYTYSLTMTDGKQGFIDASKKFILTDVDEVLLPADANICEK